MYMESYNNVDNIGYRFSLERIETVSACGS